MTRPALRRLALAVALLLGAASRPRSAAGANSLCVNHGGTGGCYGTVADALAAAADGDTIRLSGGAPYLEHVLISKSVSLIGDDPATTILDGSASGQVVHISQGQTVTLANLTVRNGLSSPGATLQEWGGGIGNDHSNLTLNNVVVSGNHTGVDFIQGAWGGGIFNDVGSLTLNDSLVSGNSTGSPPDQPAPGGHGGNGGDGGGISNFNGTLIIHHSTIRGNLTGQGAYGAASSGAGGQGGGIASYLGRVSIVDSTIRDNTTGDGGVGATGGKGGPGGGLFSGDDSLTIVNSTLSGNQTGQGGLFNGHSGNGGGLTLVNTGGPKFQITITNTTISGNATGRRSAGYDSGNGGGLYLTAGYTLTLVNDTLADNHVDPGQTGGGLANGSGSVVTLRNTLLADNLVGNAADTIQDCSGSFTSLNYNVITEPDCTVLPGPQSDDQFYVRGAIVDPLANNGGPTQTNALPPGSPAVDAADNSACSPTDQRGFRRPVFGGLALRCDVGAYELYRFGVRLPAVLR